MASANGATLLAMAQALFSDDDAAGAWTPASQAIEQLRGAGDKKGAAKAVRLAVLGLAAQDKPQMAVELGKKELDNATKSGATLAQGLATLALAEVGFDGAGGLVTKEEALKWAQTARGLFRGMHETVLEAWSLLATAKVQLGPNDGSGGREAAKQAAHTAAQAATEALAIFRTETDTHGEAQALHYLAVAGSRSGAMDAALRSAREALAVWRRAGLRKAEAAEQHCLAQAHLQDGDAKEAIAAATEALSICEDIYVFADRREWAYTETLVKAHLKAKNMKKALQTAKEGVERVQDAKDKLGEGHAFEVLALVQAEQGQMAKAIRSATKAVYAFEDAADIRCQAMAMRTAGGYQSRAGQHGKALRVVQEALDLFEELDDLPQQAKTLQQRAEVFLNKGEAKSAVRCATEARELFQDAKDQKGEAAALLQLSLALLANEDAAKAARAAEEALAMSVEAEDLEGQGAALRVVSDVHMQSEEYDAAIKVSQRALGVFREMGNSVEEIACLSSLSENHLLDIAKKDKAGKATDKNFKDSCEKALKLAKEAVAVAKKTGDKSHIGNALYHVAQCQTMVAKAPEAMKSAEEGLKYLRQSGDMRGEGATHVLVGNIHFVLAKDLESARKSAEEAIWLCQQASDQAGEDAGWGLIDRIEAVLEVERQKLLKAKQAREAQQAQAMQGGQALQMVTNQDTGADSTSMPSAARGGPKDITVSKMDMAGGLTEEAIHKQILEISKALIGSDEDIELDMPLMEAGLTSNTAVVLRDSLMEAMPGMKLPVTLTFDYPSIASMGDLMMENAAKAAAKAVK